MGSCADDVGTVSDSAKLLNEPKVSIERVSHVGSWLRTAVLLGVGYALVGILFALPATHAQAWRLAAWAVSGVGFAAHIVYERIRLKSAPVRSALHVALAAAIGAFGLAVGANIHELSAVPISQHRPMLLLSLGLWPAITAVPAFLVALGASAVLPTIQTDQRGE